MVLRELSQNESFRQESAAETVVADDMANDILLGVTFCGSLFLPSEFPRGEWKRVEKFMEKIDTN